MNILTILDEYTNSIALDKDIKMWCLNNYSQAHRIFNGVDTRRPPGKTEMPAIHLIPVNKQVGWELESIPHTMGVICEIYDENKTTETIDDVIITKYTGINNIEEFRKLIENCIQNVDVGANSDLENLRIDEIKIDYEAIEYFPFFRAFMEISFIKDLYQGDDPFE